jgi:hypothetical protein
MAGCFLLGFELWQHGDDMKIQSAARVLILPVVGTAGAVRVLDAGSALEGHPFLEWSFEIIGSNDGKGKK